MGGQSMSSIEKKNSQPILDKRNARLHDDRSKQAIRESLKQLGAGRSVLTDADNILIAGNGVYHEAVELGIPVGIIESDGRELVVIKRTDLRNSDPKRTALAIADNKCNDLSVFDDEKLEELLSEIENDPLLSAASGFSETEIAEILKQSEPDQKNDDEKPEVPFSEELMENHNYIVLYFDNDVDWLQAKSIFNLKSVRDLSSKTGYDRRGTGRVIRGADAINKLLNGGIL